ncbi:HDOD domain-containing protein [Desulfovibrio aerotolerans]|uniref:HDOD domain-containing protein n=1 Tax=Solidesulfovibrio aerotolerans TaxID=295255 RepID=A0A7C9ITS2_9BACT|nr:HDOD domain-containing protein [Solidesulfovibrio aerotolerans]MYL82760.1 HDOD domain-containing protein [Solidesulfovibrio aerotolerans]
MNSDSAQSSSAQASAFVARLLELGQPRREQLVNPAPQPRPAASLASAGRRSLADINPPPLPEAYLALRRTAENPMSGTGDVAAAVSKDPSLVAYVLRLANSPLYSSATPVETVSRAVGLIGLTEIVNLAAGAVLAKLFAAPPRPDLLSLPDFWRHAVAVGLLARALARRRDEANRERFFVAGLLHDMGRLVLAVAEPDLVAAVIARAGDGRIAMDAAERLELAFDHAALGGRICDKWRMPDPLLEGVAGHHDLSQCAGSTIAAAVHAADFIANALGVRVLPAAGLPLLNPDTLALFNLGKADPQEFADLLDTELAAMAALFTP